MKLSEQQVRHFESFGFLRLPGLFADEIDTISTSFEELFTRHEPRAIEPKDPFHYRLEPDEGDSQRLTIMPFAELHENLRFLPTDERVMGVVTSLLGPEVTYSGSDGNLFFRNTPWHADLFGPKGRGQVKVYLYLDRLDASTGAVRMIPGTHLAGPFGRTLFQNLYKQRGCQIEEMYGISPEDVPSQTIANEPGDVLVADLRTLHATFNGVPRRRLMTLNYKAVDSPTDE